MQELNYPDGKVERVFPDGRRSVLFANGTRKQHFPDGHTTIRFTNNDIKRFFHCGKLTVQSQEPERDAYLAADIYCLIRRLAYMITFIIA